MGEKRDPSERHANSNLRNLTHITQKPSYVYTFFTYMLKEITALSIIPDYAYVDGIIHAAWINVVPWPLSGLLGCRIDLPHVKCSDLPPHTCQNCPTCWRNRSPHNVSREVSTVAVSALRLKDEHHQCYALAAQERPPQFLLLSANYIVHWWRWRRRFIHSHSGCLCCVISMSN